MLPAYPVEGKSKEVTAVPEWVHILALEGVVWAFDAINTPNQADRDPGKRHD